MSSVDPHASQPVLWGGAEPSSARLAVILLHGRGSDAADILRLGADLTRDLVAYVAPQARGNSWYPFSFLAPLEDNEPHLLSALSVVARLVQALIDRGITENQIGLVGFSQGACLALEFAARNPRRYAIVAGLSGGLIGDDVDINRYSGSFDGASVFLGCGDDDPHIPLERVRESGAAFRKMGASVDERIYPSMGHIVNEDELSAIRAVLMARL